jgi:FKBP-type peptidyl-prolyl cis-trans isomerase FkpA
MDEFKFYPRVEGLEDRVTPAVSPADVNFAFFYTSAAHGALVEIGRHLGGAKRAVEIEALASWLTDVSRISSTAAGTLAEFRTSLDAQMAADPATAGVLGSLSGLAAAYSVQAQINAEIAEMIAVGFGATPLGPPAVPVAPPPVDPTPPVSPPPVSPPVSPPPLSATMPALDDPNWQTRPSGLRVWDVTQGIGTPVQPGATVTVEYIGWLAANGQKFDASADHGGATTFSLNNVIQGWQEGIPGMVPGGIRNLYIPANLAYGSAGTGTIPPNSDLVFSVLMVSSP